MRPITSTVLYEGGRASKSSCGGAVSRMIIGVLFISGS
jgi:hypothetical protein